MMAGHGKDWHTGGLWRPDTQHGEIFMRRPKIFLTKQLHSIGIVDGKGETIRIEELRHGVRSGWKKILRQDGKLLLITFSNCTVKHGDRVLFDPARVEFDMAVGEKISSV